MSATTATTGPRRMRIPVLWVLAAMALGFVFTACLPSNQPPGACEGGDGPPADQPQFAAAGGGGDGSCDVPPCDDCGSGSGDPHILTFDGLTYDYQGAAEVVAARSPDSTFEVQWRLEPRGTSRTSSITAAAMTLGGTRLSFVGEDDVVLVDGAPLDMAAGSVELASGVRVYIDDTWVIVAGPEGVGSVHMSRSEWPTVLVDAPDEFDGSMEGLLGDADGDRDDDRAALPEAGDDFHLILGETWRLDEDDTLFDYEPGVGPDDYWDPEFPPDPPPPLEAFPEEDRAAAEEQCRAAGVTDDAVLRDCIYDLLVIGDPDVIREALLLQQRRAENLTVDRARRRDAVDPQPRPDVETLVGERIVGSIDDEGQRETYEFALDAGQIVFFEGVQDGACEPGHVRWAVDGPNGSGETDVCNDLGRFIASETGTYSVVVRGVDDRGTGDFDLGVIPVPADRVEEIAVDDVREGELGSIGERHHFDVELEADEIVYFEGEPGACEPSLVRWKITGPSGGTGETDVCNDLGRFTAPTGGVYQVVVRGVDDREVGPYRFAVVGAPADRVEEIGLDDPREGEIGSIGERHRFGFELEAEQIVYLEGLRGACENGLVRWTVDGPNGTGETDVCNDLGRFVASAPGAYEITVRGVGDHEVGPYRVAVLSVPDDRVDEIDVGDSRAGEIASIGERHRFEFSLGAGQEVEFEGVQEACESGLVRWTVDGPLGTGETDICNDLGAFTAEDAGTYEIVVRGVDDRETGSYEFTIRPG